MALADGIVEEPVFSPADLALQWLKHDHQQRLVIDQARRIIWANAAAAAQLRAERELQEIGGALVAHDPGNQLLLSQFIGRCGGTPASVALPGSDGDGHVLLRGREIARGGAQRYIGLLMLRSGSTYRAEYADLETVFKLTRKEHQVLLEMVGGSTPDEVAARLGIALETARSHIRQIYAKLGVHSREKLFCRVKPYRI